MREVVLTVREAAVLASMRFRQSEVSCSPFLLRGVESVSALGFDVPATLFFWREAAKPANVGRSRLVQSIEKRCAEGRPHLRALRWLISLYELGRRSLVILIADDTDPILVLLRRIAGRGILHIQAQLEVKL